MDERRIQNGDIVSVTFEKTPTIHQVVVIGQPQDVGDCWKLYDEKNDRPYNVQMFCTMELIKRKEENNDASRL